MQVLLKVDRHMVSCFPPILTISLLSSGIILERVAPGKQYVMCVCPGKLYEFVGGPNFTALFEPYDTARTPCQVSRKHEWKPCCFNHCLFFSKELPVSQGAHSELTVLRKSRDSPAHYFAWMTEAGIFHGPLRLRDEMQTGSKESGCVFFL